MTAVEGRLNPAQQDVLAQLRGDRQDRPTVSRELRDALRAELEAELRDIEGPLNISKHALNKVHQCEGRYVAVEEFEWRPANAKGTVTHKAIEISHDGRTPITPGKLVDKAMERICESPETRSLAEYLRGIDDAERAELRVAAADLVIKFREMFPPLQPHWNVNAEATTAHYVGHRRVTFQGKIDLKIGELEPDRASTLIIDIKTGNPSFHDIEDLRFYALLETLRTGVPPFRWANVYVSAGRAEHEDFSESIMWSAAKRLIDGTRKIAELNHGRVPELHPSPSCSLCPAKPECKAATDWFAERSQF